MITYQNHMQQHIYPTELIVQYAYIPILCWQMCRNTSSSMSTDIFSRKQNVWNTSCHTWLSWEWMICFSSVIFSGGRDILRNLSRWNLSAMFQEYTTHRFVFAASRMCNNLIPMFLFLIGFELIMEKKIFAKARMRNYILSHFKGIVCKHNPNIIHIRTSSTGTSRDFNFYDLQCRVS